MVSGNIKSGIDTFGVTGDANVVDTSSGDAVAADIRSGKKAWVDGTELAGSLPTRTVINTTVDQSAGYYAAFNLSAVDGDLVSGNIKSGKNIFGVAGNSNVVDTSSGDAGAGDIRSGKKAYVAGSLVTGNVTDGSNVFGGNGNKTFTIPDGFYSDSKTATANDTNLVGSNIKSGVAIFGVSGTYPLAGVPKTGQSSSLPAGFSPPTGSDGALRMGVTLPSPRFTNNGNGTVTDRLTGLIWLQKANCAVNIRTWDEALIDLSSLNSSGSMNGRACADNSHSIDSRLPNVRELQSLIHYGYSNPAVTNTDGTAKWSTSGDAFVDVRSAFYWASSTFAGGTWQAWAVDLNEGVVNYFSKSGSPKYVWPVRGGD